MYRGAHDRQRRPAVYVSSQPVGQPSTVTDMRTLEHRDRDGYLVAGVLMLMTVAAIAGDALNVTAWLAHLLSLLPRVV